MIRKATVSDVKRISEIFSETKTPWSEESTLSSVEKDFVFVYCDDEIKGVIAASKVLDECEILNFAVESESRGKGVGKKLIKSLLESEFSKDCKVFLDVRESNIPAISLYKKMGFEQINIRKNFYSYPTENAIIMTKTT